MTEFNLHAHLRYNKAVDLTKELIDTLNVMGGEEEVEKGVSHALLQSHRTLQQDFVRMLYHVLQEYSELDKKGYFDARNEQAVKFASRVADMEDVYFPRV